jgi:hypothetical protein
MIFLTGKVKKMGKLYFKHHSGWPRNYKDENDGMDWWTYQFHIFPFIMLMMDDENLVTFGWLFWSVVIVWKRKSAIYESD